MRLASRHHNRTLAPLLATRRAARRLALLATGLAFLTLATLNIPTTATAAPTTTPPPHPVITPAQITTAPITVPNHRAPLTGTVFARHGRTLTRVIGAHIGTGDQTLQTDAMGRFTLPPGERTGAISVVAPGYRPLRTQPTADAAIFLLEPIEVRAVYLPYSELGSAATRDWALNLARDGRVNAFVIDVKHENGSVLSLVANDNAWAFGAVRDPAPNIDQFLADLRDLGIYRIARVVTFLDTSLALGAPDTALRTTTNAIFRDALDLAWTNPFTEAARRHNIEIGVNAARYFDEIQYDYVRLPTDGDVALRFQTTEEQRTDAIARFAAEAAHALHTAGAAISIDTFGLTTVATDDQGIGQILEKMAPFLDYYSPMVYPSTWANGWFDLDYPAADPFRVVHDSVAAAVRRIADQTHDQPTTIVRPWLQDFHDYGARKLFYGADQVALQIGATAAAGGRGYMLWDPSLEYELEPISATVAATEIPDDPTRATRAGAIAR